MEEQKGSWVAEEQLKKVEQVIEKEEGVTRKPTLFWKAVITVLAVGTSLFAIYCALGTITTQILRGVHVALVLTLIFLYYPMAKKYRNKIGWLDLIPVVLALASIGYMLIDFEEFIYRAVDPVLWDKVFGVILILLILGSGPQILRLDHAYYVVTVFLAYAYGGPWLPPPWTHRGYDLDRIVGHMYMTLEGIFGSSHRRLLHVHHSCSPSSEHSFAHSERAVLRRILLYGLWAESQLEQVGRW